MGIIKQALFLLAFTICILFSTVNIVKSDQMQILGHWDYQGPAHDIVADGKYLYVGVGEQVRIYDISTKEKLENIRLECINYFSHPYYGTWREKTPPVNILHTGSHVDGLFINGSYLYIQTTNAFKIADISDPPNAYIISSLSSVKGGKDTGDVEVKGDYAFITSGASIKVVNISDKVNPTLVTTISLPYGAWRLTISNDYLYVVTHDENLALYIFDITDHTNPVIVGNWSTNTSYTKGFSGIAVKDNYAYVVPFYGGVYVVDVSDPTNPIEVDHLELYGTSDIKLLDNYAYISAEYIGFHIINITDPTNISLAKTVYGFESYARGIFPCHLPYGTYVFETGWTDGWIIANVTDISKAEVLTKPWMPAPTGDSIKVRGNYAYIGAHNGGVWVLNVSDPTNPKEVAYIITGGRHWGVEIKGNYLYTSPGWGGIQVIDISDPENPKLVYMGSESNLAGYLVAVDNYLYAMGLRVYDISDPEHPKLVYNEDLGTGQPFARYGEDYLVTAGGNGVFIIDISNRTNPIVVGNVSINTETYFGRQVDILGDVVYACSYYNSRFYSIDISDVTNPVILDSINVGGPNSVIIYGTHAYTLPIVGSDGMYAINISDPSNLKVSDVMYISGSDIDEENGLLYTASGFIISPIGGGELPLQISLIKVSSITENSAIISWQTNKEADSLVKYGTSPGSYPEQKYDPTLTKYHSIKLDGLQPNTTYYFVVESKTANETATSTEKSFKTRTSVTVGTLCGKVTDKDTSLPIEGAIIKANSYQTTTNSSGEYIISLPVGNYTINVSKPGYLSQSKTITIHENQTITLNFSIPGINLYLNIKTTKDNYGIEEVVNLTDPPEEERKEEAPYIYNFFKLIFEGFLIWIRRL